MKFPFVKDYGYYIIIENNRPVAHTITDSAVGIIDRNDETILETGIYRVFPILRIVKTIPLRIPMVFEVATNDLLKEAIKRERMQGGRGAYR
jgi:hypothetical protein